MFYLHWNLGWQKRFLVFDKDVLSSRFINILSVHQIDFYFHGTRARTLAFFDTYSALCMTPLPHLQSCRLQRPRFPRSVSIGIHSPGLPWLTTGSDNDGEAARRLSSSSRVPCAHHWALGMHAVEPGTAKDVEQCDRRRWMHREKLWRGLSSYQLKKASWCQNTIPCLSYLDTSYMYLVSWLYNEWIVDLKYL